MLCHVCVSRACVCMGWNVHVCGRARFQTLIALLKRKMRKVCHLPTTEDKFEPVEVLIPIGGVKVRSSAHIRRIR